jgi:hypothetical protein
MLAHRLGKPASTVTRALRGETGKTHALHPQALAEALNLDQISRRTFVEAALDAGLFALVSDAYPHYGRFISLERRFGIPLDDFQQVVGEIRAQRQQGNFADAFLRARELFEGLFDDVSAARLPRDVPKLAQVRLLAAFEYCEAQATTLGWFARTSHMLKTLNRMEREVLTYFPPGRFPSEFGHLINLRAPLYRSLPGAIRGDHHYCKGIAEFSWALVTFGGQMRERETSLYIELLRNRAHLYLLSGESRRWKADLEGAERALGVIRGSERELFEGLVRYSWGEGYKRIGALPQLSARDRDHFHRLANRYLVEGRCAFDMQPLWAGYGLLARIAEVECLGWSDPEEAIEQASALLQRVQQNYPSLEQKVARMERDATRRLRG